jgi:tetratricopeptide (TPR) repeat protein
VTRRVAFYNPRDASPEVLEELFVGRGPLLDEILEDLAHQAAGPSRQHWLIRGQRGMGKTHLAGLLDHRARTDPRLSGAYIPIWLGEADVYEVYSAGMLLVQVAERLRDELVRSRAEGAEQFAAALASLPGSGDDEALFEDVCELISTEARARGRILLVLMENLDALLADRFASKVRMVETKRFRSLLLHEKAFVFVSTTPTRYLPLTDPKKPLYGHLKERVLGPLAEDQTRELFGKLARVTGGEPEAKGGVDPIRLKVIHQLTGGLPRSLVMAFQVMSNAQGVEAIQADFRTLLDQQTAYFEARLARLASREGAIVTAMALAETNLTMQEIARRTRLGERSLPTLMKRLIDDGHVERTYGGGGKGTVYGLTDGLFRAWYQYRKGKGNLDLIRFMAFWYEPDALQGTVERLLAMVAVPEVSHADRWSTEAALRQVEEALRLATSEEGRRQKDALWEECRRQVEAANKKQQGPKWETVRRRIDRATKLFAANDYAKAIPFYRKTATDLEKMPTKTQAEGDALAKLRQTCMSMIGTSLAYSGQLMDAEAVFRKNIEQCSMRDDGPARDMAMEARGDLGGILFQLGRKNEAHDMYRNALANWIANKDEFSSSLMLVLLNPSIIALIKEEPEGDLSVPYRQIVSRAMNSPVRSEYERPLAAAAYFIASTLSSSGRVSDGIPLFRYAFEHSTNNQLAVGVNFVELLIRCDNYDEARIVCEQAIGILAKDSSVEARQYGAQIHLLQGALRLRRGELDEATDSLDISIRSVDDVPGDNAAVTFMAHLLKAFALAKRGEREKSQSAIDAVVTMFAGQVPENSLIAFLLSDKILESFSLPTIQSWFLALGPKLKDPESIAVASVYTLLVMLAESLGPDPAQWVTEESNEAYHRLLGRVPPEQQQLVKDIIAKIAKIAKIATPASS